MSNAGNGMIIQALKVKQWLDGWDQIDWKGKGIDKDVPHWFYQFSIPAVHLRMLSGVYPRTTDRDRGVSDYGIQRRHEPKRSQEIKEFVKFGYPLSGLSTSKRESNKYKDLQQPGWLPTAIVINILEKGEKRGEKQVASQDLIKVEDIDDHTAQVIFPVDLCNKTTWKPEFLPPVEIIDGQHRLWAFDEDLGNDFEVPVMAFSGLHIKLQAYLFYTINIKPKRINASLAFDLYPLLRNEEWLVRFEGPGIYRETRSQELVDLLWSYPKSPWHQRINMLGEPGHRRKMLTQSAWVRSLMASFVKSWEANRTKIGGLFGASIGKDNTVLPWDLYQQAAFLSLAGMNLQNALLNFDIKWINQLNNNMDEDLSDSKDIEDVYEKNNPALYGESSLLNQDQGIRVFLQVVNDMFFVKIEDDISMYKAVFSGLSDDLNDEDSDKKIENAIHEFKQLDNVIQYLNVLIQEIAKYDWRSSGAQNLEESEKERKLTFRGGSGYKNLRVDVLKFLAESNQDLISINAKKIYNLLGYN